MDTKVKFAREGEIFVLTPSNKIPNKRTGLKYNCQLALSANEYMLNERHFPEDSPIKDRKLFNFVNPKDR